MKKILAIAAAAALTAGVSAYAANPFADVTPNDWAYQAVSSLSDQGIVEGYPDGTFKGQQNMTRYELAQITARLLAKEDQYNAEQRATIDKLAAEYADELNSLGVRVDNLEKKVGNIKFTGDARMRYQDSDKKGNGSDSYNGRIRLVAKATVNEDTFVQGRFVYNMDFKDSDKDTGVYTDNLFVDHKFGKTAEMKLGRYGLTFGNQGGWLYGSADSFDGAEIGFNVGKNVKVLAGYGQFNAGDDSLSGSGENKKAIADIDTFYAKGIANLKVANVYVDYIASKEAIKNTNTKLGDNKIGDNFEIIGGGVVVPINDFRVAGEYYTNTLAPTGGDAWNAGIGYGKMNLSKPGTFAVDMVYNDIERNVYFDGTGLQTSVINSALTDNITYWNFLGDLVLAKNTYLHAEYAFAADGDKADPDDSWTLSFNYKF